MFLAAGMERHENQGIAAAGSDSIIMELALGKIRPLGLSSDGKHTVRRHDIIHAVGFCV